VTKDPGIHSRKIVKAVSLLYFLAIMALGIYFGLERALFCDSTMQLYDMANKGFPRVNPSMLATVINFILPYLAIVTGMSVKVIVYALAINYLLLPLAVFIFLRYRQMSLKYELAFLVTFSLFNWQTFYFPIHDYWTGFYFLLVLYRLSDDRSLVMENRRRLIFEHLLIVGMMFTHLSIVISLGFLYLYLFVERVIGFRKIVRVYAFILLVLVLKVFFVSYGYQRTMSDPSGWLDNGITGILQSGTMQEFLGTLLRTNLNFVFLGAISLMLSIYRKQFLPALMLGVVFLTSLVVINLLFADFGYSIYTEGYFKSMNLVAGIILANILYVSLSGSYLYALILSANFIFSGIVLWLGGSYIRSKFDFVRDTCKKFSTNVYLHSNKEICPLEFIVFSRQSILINQLDNHVSRCVVVDVGDVPYVENLNEKYIRDDQLRPARYFKYTGAMIHLDADSMGIELERYPTLFENRRCDEMIRRLDQ
jgi:hypothetical protein